MTPLLLAGSHDPLVLADWMGDGFVVLSIIVILIVVFRLHRRASRS